MNIGFSQGWLVAAGVLALACGGENKGAGGGQAGSSGSGGSGVAGSGAGGSGGSGASGAGSGGTSLAGSPDLGTPILERPAEVTHDCKVSRPMALLGLNPWASGGLHASDDTARLLRIESSMPGVAGLTSKVAWSTLDSAGKLGATQALPGSDMGWRGQLASAVAGERSMLAWVEAGTDGTRLAFAAVSAAGEVLVPTKPLASGAEQYVAPTLAGLANGVAVAWTSQASGKSKIELVRLDQDGEPTGDPQNVVEGAGLLQANELVPFGDGFLLLYSKNDYSANVEGNFYQRLDASGAPEGEPVKLGNGFGATSTMPRGDRLLVAWTEQKGAFDSKISRTIHLGTIEADGTRGDTYALQADVDDQENVDPRWVDLGDDVGLFWSQGSVIYICAGCFPDNELRFVVLGGDDLARKSEVLSLPSPNAFGLRTPHAVSFGDDILTIASVTHHVDAEGASATIRCSP